MLGEFGGHKSGGIKSGSSSAVLRARCAGALYTKNQIIASNVTNVRQKLFFQDDIPVVLVSVYFYAWFQKV